MTSRFPLSSFPEGWFQVACSDGLAAGQVTALHYFGRDLVLFRTGDGKASLLDAHCPHLGAHLGHGGRVEGDGIRCPFHGWRFSGEGVCEDIPYSKSIPAKASLPAWPLKELDGRIFMFHHPQRRAPSFELKGLPERSAPRDWTLFPGRRWRIRTHIQEPLENFVDAAHFRYLHDHPSLPANKVSCEGPVLRCRTEVKMRAGSRLIEGTIDLECTGMGYAVLRLSGAVKSLIVCTFTPVDAESIELDFSFSSRKDGDLAVGEAIFNDIVRQIEQDVQVWEHKVYRAQPLLADGEGGISVLRGWCRQFLSTE